MTLHSHGDSLTAGYGVSDTARLYYPWFVANWFDVPMVNHAVAGMEACDLWDNISALGPVAGDKHYILIGENNEIKHGGGADQLASFRTQLAAMTYWLGSSKRTLQHPDWSFTGAWLNDASVGKYTDGAATATVQFSGNVFKLGYIIADYYAAGFNVTIDGVSQGDFTCLAPPIESALTGRRYAPALLRLDGFAPGTHTAVITSIGADSSHFTFIDCIYDAPDSNGDISLLTLPRGTAAAYSGYPPGFWSDTVVAAYNAQIEAIVSQAQADGLNVSLIDIEPLLDPDTCTIWSGDHPNNLGHVKIAKAILGFY